VGAERDQAKHSRTLVLREEFASLGSYVGPRTPIEDKLAEIFSSVLGMDKVSVTDDFEDLGGDSLLAVSICTEIEKAFRIAVPVAFLVRAPTIEQLAPKVEDLVSKHKV
jgi:acyl carrier protein